MNPYLYTKICLEIVSTLSSNDRRRLSCQNYTGFNTWFSACYIASLHFQWEWLVFSRYTCKALICVFLSWGPKVDVSLRYSKATFCHISKTRVLLVRLQLLDRWLDKFPSFPLFLLIMAVGERTHSIEILLNMLSLTSSACYSQFLWNLRSTKMCWTNVSSLFPTTRARFQAFVNATTPLGLNTGLQ